MSIWEDLELETLVLEALANVSLASDHHHFGRPWITAYQLAIELERQRLDVVVQMGKPVGGAGVGERDSVARYLAHQLSQQVRDRGAHHPVEGSFLSNKDAVEIRYRRDNGDDIRSSMTGTSFDTSLFRLRER